MVILLILKIQAEVRIEKAEKPSHGIVDIANKENARFIVTGSRGMGVIRRTILGSVSDFILHHANCPVFVYKMQWNAQLTPTIHEKLYYIKSITRGMLWKNDLDDIFMLYFAQWFQSEHSLYFSLHVMRLRKHKSVYNWTWLSCILE